MEETRFDEINRRWSMGGESRGVVNSGKILLDDSKRPGATGAEKRVDPAV